MKVVRKCAVCFSEQAKLLYQPLRIVRCCSCGLIYRDVVKGELNYKELEKYSFIDEVKKITRRRESFARVELISKYLLPGDSILDIGSNEGSFLVAAKDKGFKVFGCEPNKYAADQAKRSGLDVECGYFDDVFSSLKKKGPFSAVTMFHVLEHLDDPVGFLIKVRELMSEKSLLIVEVPDISSPLSRIYGWEDMRINKEHLCYFNRDSLSAILGKAGFEIILSKRKVWDGANQPFIGNLIRLPGVSFCYKAARVLKKNIKKIFGRSMPRKELGDNNELWCSSVVKQPYKPGFISGITGRLVAALDRGDDLFCVSVKKDR